jgi:hypothetical protein
VLNADFRYWQILLQKSAAADGRSVISLRAASAMIDSTVGMVGRPSRHYGSGDAGNLSN